MNTGAEKLAESHLKNPNDLFAYDSEKRRQYSIICGIDEAGRGPLAGDVYAAAVVLSDDVVIDGLDDSKKLTEKKRELLYDEIKQKATAYCIATATIDEIEKFNILGATFLAMKRAYEGVCKKITPDLTLVDGNQVPPVAGEVVTIIKGDGTSASIAAASILAKVERDHYMNELDKQYPQYMFAKHKGYGTKLHYEMLEQYGISPVHRRSFLKKWLATK